MKLAPLCLSLLAATAVACSAAPQGEGDEGELLDAYSSSEATLLEFEFDGELTTDTAWNVEQTIRDQMLYTIGHLNGNRSVGRLDALSISDVKETKNQDGTTKVTYHAKLPVSWGSKTNLPKTYEFTLPRLASYQGFEAFTNKYKHDCVDWGAHDVDSGSMWYYFRPAAASCKLDAGDVVKFTASVVVSKLNTDGKYPEYDKVWEDGELDVVAVFGKYEDGAMTTSDAGISGYNRFVSTVATQLRSKAKSLTTTPAMLPPSPGVETPDVSFAATLADGKKVNVIALLVDNVSSAPQSFYTRYEALSTKADVIVYNGHAGLGQNVRALARKGKFERGKYLMVFMNGCDTFAYVDGYLAEARAAINPDDPTGTKYMDIVTNTMPSFFSSMPSATMALVNGLLSYDAPLTYQQMFQNIDRSEVVVVTGEEDNQFTPGAQPPPPSGWAGIDASFTVAKGQEKRFSAQGLQPGTYAFTLDGAGDADLYVRIGSAPTTRTYTCRPFLAGSKERCEVKLTEKTDVHVMVRGWAASSSVKLTGRSQ